MVGRGYVLNVGRGYVINVGRGYVIQNHELMSKEGIELLGQLKSTADQQHGGMWVSQRSNSGNHILPGNL